jgi:ribosomal protein S12 methylthiotransferase
MRGKHRSFALDEIVREAQLLEAQGARELNLVAQDLAIYGRDRRGDSLGLPDVLQALLRETSLPWIRMLYVYFGRPHAAPARADGDERRIVPYLDMPIQHGSDAFSRVCAAQSDSARFESASHVFATPVPDVAIRTTCIVGFPGETDADFEMLLEFLEEIQFDRSARSPIRHRKGTRAAEMDDDVPEGLKLEPPSSG